MHAISKWLPALVLLAGPVVSNAAPVTYAFTGVVTSSNNPSLFVGEYVTGTYTFHYDSADKIIGAVYSFLTPAPWVIGSSGVPYNPVFSSTAKIGDFIYSSGTTTFNDPDDSSIVTGNGFSTVSASEAVPASDIGSFFTMYSEGGSTIYTNQGYPVTLSGRQSGYGGLAFWGQFVTYKITSLTPAPAPPPATLLAALLTEATGVGPGDSLADKVERAQTDYAAGDVQRACHVLAEFLHEVQRQDGRTIAPLLDANLTKQAQAIAATIGCQ